MLLGIEYVWLCVIIISMIVELLFNAYYLLFYCAGFSRDVSRRCDDAGSRCRCEDAGSRCRRDGGYSCDACRFRLRCRDVNEGSVEGSSSSAAAARHQRQPPMPTAPAPAPPPPRAHTERRERAQAKPAAPPSAQAATDTEICESVRRSVADNKLLANIPALISHETGKIGMQQVRDAVLRAGHEGGDKNIYICDYQGNQMRQGEYIYVCDKSAVLADWASECLARPSRAADASPAPSAPSGSAERVRTQRPRSPPPSRRRIQL